METLSCPYHQKCWRYSYSRFLIERGGWELSSPPDRFFMLMAGYATQEMLIPNNKQSLYAECFPSPSAEGYINLCPELDARSYKECHEYKREQKREKRIEKLREADALKEKRYSEKHKRQWIPKEIRRQVAEEASWRCEYCGAQQNSYREDGSQVRCVVDHLIPLAKGGTDDRSNLVFACRRCNSQKSTQIWQRGCRLPGTHF